MLFRLLVVEGDQTLALQAAIDEAAARGVALELPAGTMTVGTLTLRPHSVLLGQSGLTTLSFIGTLAAITAQSCVGVTLAGFVLKGNNRPVKTALISLASCSELALESVRVAGSSSKGIDLSGCTGVVRDCHVSQVADAGIAALDSTLTIVGNTVNDCGNNGILIWRTTPGRDGSMAVQNRISNIRADGGGSGENGNAINIFRAGDVHVADNTITGCAYSAVRGNAASNLSITGNICRQLGEVALYAEFGFEGALIANNIVDGAATGISVTNFNEGGRLAVVQGNLIRNIVRRDAEPVDKRGEGITAEADTLVNGNTIENAATCGIVLGWGHYMRDVSATNNVIRKCPHGILVSGDAAAGSALVTGNVISGASVGAIRAHDTGRAFGPDLARVAPTSGRVTITGNQAG